MKCTKKVASTRLLVPCKNQNVSGGVTDMISDSLNYPPFAARALLPDEAALWQSNALLVHSSEPRRGGSHLPFVVVLMMIKCEACSSSSLLGHKPRRE